MIAERGVAATRIADVAERAGTSPPAVLYWFETQDELLAEALTLDEEASTTSSPPPRGLEDPAPARCSR